MIDFIKNLSKDILSPLGIFLSHNQRYDWQLKKIIQQLTPEENEIALIDIGAHKGEVTDLAMRYHNSKFLLFEPIPSLYKKLNAKYENNASISVCNLGLADKKGQSTFQLNHTHLAYSGIQRREYPSEQDKVEEITIQLDKLDNVINALQNIESISLIKIDVEGAELGVLLGAKETIKSHQPLVVFEHGLGASEFYDTKPEAIFEFFTNLNMDIQTMEDWLNKKSSSFTLEDFKKQFYEKLNYYFIAYPKQTP